jgi:hypothetical protein
MFGRATASQIAAASIASVLPRLTWALAYFGGISFTLVISRTQKCALPHASMPTRHGGSLAKNANTCLRLSFRATTTLPSASTPWT